MQRKTHSVVTFYIHVTSPRVSKLSFSGERENRDQAAATTQGAPREKYLSVWSVSRCGFFSLFFFLLFFLFFLFFYNRSQVPEYRPLFLRIPRFCFKTFGVFLDLCHSSDKLWPNLWPGTA